MKHGGEAEKVINRFRRFADASGKTAEINALCSFFMTVNAETDVCVSGVSEVCDFSDCEIKLKCMFFSLIFKGIGLKIENFSFADTVITGKIESIEIERGGEKNV